MILSKAVLVVGNCEVLIQRWQKESLHDLDRGGEEGDRPVGGAYAGVLAGLEQGDDDGLLPDVENTYEGAHSLVKLQVVGLQLY